MFTFNQNITKDLSVIIPFVNEYPQIKFTVSDIFCELYSSGINFEIIVIDNMCNEVKQQRLPDKGSEIMQSLAIKRDWLRYLSYDKKLSHWQAKNLGVENASSQIFLFIDSHCIVSKDSIVKAFNYYKKYQDILHGTLHLPLAYMLEHPGKELTYKLVTDLDKAIVHYSFTHYAIRDRAYVAPCMSTCGMFMTKQIFSALGGWPEELGIYGGGENFINFTLATLGYNVVIFPSLPLYHHADKRGYSWNYTDFHRNRCIASYMYGGEEFAYKYVKNLKGNQTILEKIYYDVVTKCKKHRDYLIPQQKISIEDWVKKYDEDAFKGIILPKPDIKGGSI
jgi:predicted glycosyltransferase involved in capsule biosynthesis